MLNKRVSPSEQNPYHSVARKQSFCERFDICAGVENCSSRSVFTKLKQAVIPLAETIVVCVV